MYVGTYADQACQSAVSFVLCVYPSSVYSCSDLDIVVRCLPPGTASIFCVHNNTQLQLPCPVPGSDYCTCQVAVPQADMEEIVPAARLLSRATAVSPSDYDRAKTLFLEGLQNAGVQAEVNASHGLHCMRCTRLYPHRPHDRCRHLFYLYHA